jgi:alpha-L-fucosidase
VRWVGNERGIAPETSWHTLNAEGVYPGLAGAHEFLPEAHRNGTHWMPAEADVSIRPGWFYHAAEDDKVKTPPQLLDIYYASVGHGACLNLNLPPDRRGLIHETDAAKLREFRRLLDETFANNLADGATVTADAIREGDFSPAHILDGRQDTFWAAPDGMINAELVFELASPTQFDVIQIGEYIPLGQRLESFGADAWQDADWKPIATGTSVGYKKLIRLDTPVETAKVRLRLHAPVPPTLAHFGLYLQPSIERNARTETGDPALARWTILSGEHGWTPYAPIAPGPVPQEIIMSPGHEFRISGFTYLPRQDGNREGIVSHYEFWLSRDGENWEQVAAGEFANIANNPILQTVTWDEPRLASSVKIVVRQVVAGDTVGAGEVGSY